MVSARVGTIPLTPPPSAVAAMAALSLGTYIPLGGAITGVVPTLNTPPGSVTFTVTGVWIPGFLVFTGHDHLHRTLVASPAPSGDAGQPSRILSVTGATTLTTTTTGPSPTLALAATFLSLVAPAVGPILQPQIEAAINGTIDGLVAPGLASLGFLRSPTSVVSARRVTITSSGMGLSLVLADLLGPAISPIPGDLHATVSPAPKAGGQRVYTATVTNSATGTPINQADVTLHNYTASGIAQTVGPLQTNTSGQVTFNVALHPKITFQVTPIITSGSASSSLRPSPSPRRGSTPSASGFWRTPAISSSTAPRAVTPWPILVSPPLARRLAPRTATCRRFAPRHAIWWAVTGSLRPGHAVTVPPRRLMRQAADERGGDHRDCG